MSLEINGSVAGDVAGRDIVRLHAMPCPGPHYGKDEFTRQRDFEESSGIACSAGARQALLHLIETGVFDYRQLALAWGQRSLWWDWHSCQLQAKVLKLELWYGYFLVLLAAGSSLALLISWLALEGPEPISVQSSQVVAMAVALLFAVPLCQKYLIRPNHIAARALPLLEDFYASEPANKKDGGPDTL